jgi:hypothetical protein
VPWSLTPRDTTLSALKAGGSLGPGTDDYDDDDDDDNNNNNNNNIY